MEALLNMSTRIRFRRDTAANWTSNNPILTTGELGYETNTGKFKIGNNTNAWTALPYSITAELSEGNLNDLKDVTITSAADGDFLRWNGTAWINDAVNLGTDTTGSYVTSLVAGTGVSVSNNSGESATPTIAIGQSVGTAATVTFATVTTTGDVTVGGNLTVSGTTTSINTETLTVNDNIIVLNNNATGAPSENAGIEVERGSSTNVAIRWNETTDKWESTTDGSTYVDINDHGSLGGLADDDHTQYLTSARHDILDHTTVMSTVQLTDINDVNTSATPANNTFLRYNEGAWVDTAITLGTNTTGSYVESLTAGTGVTLTNATASEGGTPTIAIGQDVASSTAPTFAGLNLNGSIVFEGATADAFETTLAVTDPTADRTVTFPDVSGTVITTGDTGSVTSTMIADGTVVNADINASAAIAHSKLANATAGQVLLGTTTTGVVTATTISGDITINGAGVATIAANSVALGTDTTGNYVSGVSSGTGISVSHTPSEGSTATVSLDATLDNLSDVTVPSPTSGDFLKWNGTAWVNDAIDLGTDTTGNYVATITGGTGVTSTAATTGEGTTHTLSIGQSVATSANPSFAGATLDLVQIGITTAGEIDTTSGNLTIDSAGGTVTVDDNLTVTGNLTVSGTTTSINTETLTIDDNIIILNNNEAGTPSQNAGIEVERGTSTNVVLRWNETTDKWEATNDGSTYGNLVTTADSGTVTSTMIADGTIVDADINASAAIAHTKLAAATAGQVLLGTTTTGVVTATTVSGDVTITGAGVTAIATGVIVNADVSATAAIDLGKLADVSTSAQTASYTLVLADKNKIVEMSVATANTLTVPPNSSVAYAVGSQINILQTGAGQTTVTAGAGVTINAAPGLKMRTQWSYATLIKRATDTWVLVGDISA